MNVAPQDGVCRECGGPLQIIDSDDCTMTVECQDCRDVYDIEPDALNDGRLPYFVPLQIQKLAEGESDGPDRRTE